MNFWVSLFYQLLRENLVNSSHCEEYLLVDALATLSSMLELNQEEELPMIKMKSHKHPVYCYFIEEELDDKPWYLDIKWYLRSREYPKRTTKNDKQMLRRLVAKFVLKGDVIYKRNYDIVLFICVDAKEVKLILKEIHDRMERIWMDILWLERSWGRVTSGWPCRMTAAYMWENATNVKYMQAKSMSYQ